MGYNKVKRTFDMIANVIGIVLGLVLAFIIGYNLVSFSIILSAAETFLPSDDTYGLIGWLGDSLTAIIVVHFIAFVLCICLIVVCAKMCKKPIATSVGDYGFFPKIIGKNVFLFILLPFMCVVGILSIIFTKPSFIAIALIILFKLPAFFIPAGTPIEQAPRVQYLAPKNQQTETNSLERDIKELKHLKETGVLNDEQYEKAVNKVLEKIK